MPAPQQSKLFGGVTPLGIITVSTAGTPVALTTNLVNQAQGSSPSTMDPKGRPFTGNCRQLVFSAPSANTGDVYIMYGNFAHTDTNAALLVVPKGVVAALPYGCLCESSIDVTSIWVDVATSGDKIIVTAVDGS